MMTHLLQSITVLNTKLTPYTEAFNRVGVSTLKVTHANCKNALNITIAQEDVAGVQQRRVGRWGTYRMVGCYVSSLPVEAIKSLVGLGCNVNYFLIRTSVIPPMSLQVLNSPDVKYWEGKFKNKDSAQECSK